MNSSYRKNTCILLVSPFLSEQDADHLYGMIGAPDYVNVWNQLHGYFIWGYDGVSEENILATVDSFDNTHLKAAPTNNRLFLGEWCMGGPPNQNGIFQNLDNFRELGRKQFAYYNADLTGGWAFWSWHHDGNHHSEKCNCICGSPSPRLNQIES
ncbi:unnamed protein product [Phytophthora fragariaefolia]|uniref:Unnamed protein product n=1 Tax=Phytophthora fragariaefolia TaxID=1490495 RepID=A0A9W6XWR0_9STRA|nr:unnamed protein product [Phytophthora fragariaefolia]